MSVGRFLVARSLVLAACVAGCASLAGINDGNDGAASSGDIELPTRDGSAPSEGGTDTDASCTRGSATDTASRFHASKVALDAPVMVNGDPVEWGCVDRLDFSTGGRSVGTPAGHDTAEIAMQWDEQHIYLLARVTTDSPGGTATGDQIFKNDSVHLIIAGPEPQPATPYRATDHQIAFDYMSFVAGYAGGSPRTPNGITAKTGPFKSENGVLTFVVEARIDAAIVGRPGGFTQGERVRVNFQINDAAGAAYRLWYWEGAVCTPFSGCNVGGVSEPYCDPHCSGEVELR